MANYYSILTANRAVPCTPEEFNTLEGLLSTPDKDGDCLCHGLLMEYWNQGEDPDWGVYLFTDESVDTDEIPEAFLDALGNLIKKAGLEYLECGIAFTCDKPRAGSHGGTDIRIFPDGQLLYPEKVFLWFPRDASTGGV